MATGDQADIFGRLRSYLPSRWFGAPSDVNPIRDAVMQGLATSLSYLYGLYQYAKLQTRIATATDGWLDMIAADFYGTTLPRKTGESDSSYRSRIMANLAVEKATRNGITQALYRLTGRMPKIVEPWRPYDTGVYVSLNGPYPAMPSVYGSVGYRRATLVGASIYRNDWQGNQLLFAAARTNISVNSSMFSGWSPNQATKTNGLPSPDGLANAVQVMETTAVGQHYLNTGTWAAPGINTTYTASIFAKPINNRYIVTNFGDGGSLANVQATFDIVAGSIVGTPLNCTAFIQPAGNGFFRCFIVFTTSATATLITPRWATSSAPTWLSSNYAGTVTNGAYMAYSHCEATTLATSYIPTTTAPVTITDYTQDSLGDVWLAIPPVVGAQVTCASPNDGLPAGTPMGTGDGVTTLFWAKIPDTTNYGGAYGSLNCNAQAFITAYRPTSGASYPNVTGYSGNVGAYSTGSQFTYVSLLNWTGGIADSDIYAAIAATKAEGTIMWSRISN